MEHINYALSTRQDRANWLECDSFVHQALLDRIPSVLIDDRFMLTLVHLVLVPDAPGIDRVGQDVMDMSAVERAAGTDTAADTRADRARAGTEPAGAATARADGTGTAGRGPATRGGAGGGRRGGARKGTRAPVATGAPGSARSE